MNQIKYISMMVLFIVSNTTLYTIPAALYFSEEKTNKPYLALVASLMQNKQKDYRIYNPAITPDEIKKQATKQKEFTSEKGTIIIDYFNRQGNNIGRQESDEQENTLTFIIFHPDQSQTVINYLTEGKKEIIEFESTRKFKQKIEVNKNNTIISLYEMHHDQTSSKTEYHPNKTKSYYRYDAEGKNISQEIFDQFGNPIRKIEWYEDETYSITEYNQDKSYVTIYYDTNKQYSKKSYTNPQGEKKEGTKKLITAWHEAGHAVMSMHTQTMQLIKHITIIPQQMKDGTHTHGHVQNVYTYDDQPSSEELENLIMVNLAGGIGEQIFFNEPMFLQDDAIINYFQKGQFKGDMKNVDESLKKIFKDSSTPQSFSNVSSFTSLDQKSKSFIATLYKKAYQFLIHRKADLKIIAEKLMKSETILTDEAYELIKVNKPLMYYEQGPLSLNHVNDYQHRGFSI